MQHSPPGRKLNPKLKSVADSIYSADRHRYARLCLWIWHQQKSGRSDETIAKTLELARPYLDSVKNWWKYLTALARKGSAVAHEEENQYYKNDLTSVKGILKRIVREDDVVK
jgi:hypothetical protein